jgi:uncharacterized protein (DUF2062 family)
MSFIFEAKARPSPMKVAAISTMKTKERRKPPGPWTFIPIYTVATWCGAKMLGVDFVPSDIDFSSITSGTIIADLGYLLKSFIVGTLTLGFIISVVFYPVTYSLFKKFHKDE